MGVTESRIRYLLRDNVQRLPTFETLEIVDAVDRAQFAVLADLPGIEAWNATWQPLSASTFEYTNTVADAHTFNAFRLTSTGAPVILKDPALFDQYRSGNPVATGAPLILCVMEKSDGNYTVRVWPTPNASGNIEALRSSVPTPANIASTLDYAQQTLRAIEYRAAAEVLMSSLVKTDSEGIDKAGAKEAIAVLLDLSAKAVGKEDRRLSRQRRQSEPVLTVSF